MDNEPRWLDDEEREAWVGLASMLIRLPAALDRQLRRDSGMSHFDYQMMVMLSNEPDRTLSMSSLSASTEGSLPRLSQVATRLTKAGWIERRPDPNDGRSTLATLTDLGFEQLTAAAPLHVDHVRALIFDQLDREQVGQLAKIADQILQSEVGGPDPRALRRNRAT